MESNRMRLIVGRESGFKVELHGGEHIACHDTSMRHTTNCPVIMKVGRIGSRVDRFDSSRLGEGDHWKSMEDNLEGYCDYGRTLHDLYDPIKDCWPNQHP